MRNTDGKKLSLMANMGLTRVLLVPLLFMALMSLHVFANDDHHHDTSEKSGEDQIVQKFCPVQPEEEIDPDLFVDYQGQKVFLCCKMCQKKFLANPTPYLSRLPQFAALSPGDP
ncbi:MAG: hypothetical protein IID32_10575, partial [Planctomycetes bacterium]|nr:hypothetical protein [Planctomycetota bacterium]